MKEVCKGVAVALNDPREACEEGESCSFKSGLQYSRLIHPPAILLIDWGRHDGRLTGSRLVTEVPSKRRVPDLPPGQVGQVESPGWNAISTFRSLRHKPRRGL